MLNHLKIETVHALMEFATARAAVNRLRPQDDSNSLDPFKDMEGPYGDILYPLYRGMLALIRGMSREQKIELVALMWSGREGQDFDRMIKSATSEVDGRGNNPAAYVAGKPLARYLRHGLERLGLPVPPEPLQSVAKE